MFVSLIRRSHEEVTPEHLPTSACDLGFPHQSMAPPPNGTLALRGSFVLSILENTANTPAPVHSMLQQSTKRCPSSLPLAVPRTDQCVSRSEMSSKVRLKTSHLAGASTQRCQRCHSTDTAAHVGTSKVLVLPDHSAILIVKWLAWHCDPMTAALLSDQSTAIGAILDQLQLLGTWHNQLVALSTCCLAHGA